MNDDRLLRERIAQLERELGQARDALEWWDSRREAAEQDAARLAAALRKAHDQLEHYVVCRGEGRGQPGCEATDALAAHEERVKR